jgi:NADH:ubiquinone oxidoreductase subunit K
MREDSRAGVKLVTLVGAALLLGFAVVDYISVSTLSENLPESGKKEVLIKYILSILACETLVTLVVLLLVYRNFTLFLKRERATKEMVKLFFLLFTHKFGNFLSLNRINLEILTQKYGNDRSLLRLKRSYNVLEEDFKNSLRYIKGIEESQSPEWVDVSEVIRSSVLKYSSVFPEKGVELSLMPLKVRARRQEVESFFQLLIENAFKYASSSIKIELSRERRGYRIILVNDVGTASSGTGIGLKLLKFLADKIGWEVDFFPGKKLFITEIRL